MAEQKAHEMFLASMTEKELKRYNTKMKKLAREKERQQQDDERKEITRQRKLYFKMIQDNDIDRAFDLKAEKGGFANVGTNSCIFVISLLLSSPNISS